MADEKNLQVLLIEDDPDDAFLIREMMSDGKEAAVRIEHRIRLVDGIDRMRAGGIDLVLLDLGLPESHGLDTLRSILPIAGEVPIIVLTGLSDAHTGAEAVREGAQDYLIKGQVNDRMLGRSILYAIERKKFESEQKKLIQKLNEALAKVKLLTGMLPICASCKKIKNNKGCWEQIEVYILDHSDAEFSHGICDDCAKKLYPNIFQGGLK